MAKYSMYGIYTYVRNALKTAYPDLYVTGGDEPIPHEGLAVEIKLINYYRPKGNVTLDNDDVQLKVAYDVNVYSSLFDGADEEVYTIIHVAEQAFRELFFIETECMPVERSDNRVTRLVARFERQLGLGNDMPEGETS